MMKQKRTMKAIVPMQTKLVILGIMLTFCLGQKAQAQSREQISSAYNEAIKLIDQKNYEAAETKLSQVIKWKNEYAEAVFARGTCRLMLNKRSEACDDFERAKALHWKPAQEYIDKFCGKDAIGRKFESKQEKQN